MRKKKEEESPTLFGRMLHRLGRFPLLPPSTFRCAAADMCIFFPPTSTRQRDSRLYPSLPSAAARCGSNTASATIVPERFLRRNRWPAHPGIHAVEPSRHLAKHLDSAGETARAQLLQM